MGGLVSALVAVLRLQDDMTPALKRASHELQKSSRDWERIGADMSRMGRGLTLGVTTPLLGVAAASFQMASSAQENANKFNVVMGSSADDVRERLEELTKTIPLTRAEMEGLAGGVQDMLVPMGVARGEAAGMSATMVELAGDLGSFNDVGADEVLEAMKSALAGSSEPMRRFGVDTREAALAQVALDAGLIGVGEAMDSSTRAQAVLLAIQRDSTDAMGDAAATADSAANSVRFLWRDVKDLGQMLGDVLIPIVTPWINTLREWIGGLRELSPEAQKWIVGIGAAAAAVGPLLMVVGTLISTLAPLAPIVGTVVAVLSGPVGWVVALGAVLLAIKPVREAVFAFIGYLKDRALAIVDGIRESFRKWGEALEWLKGKLGFASDEIAAAQGVTEAASTAVDLHSEFLAMQAQRSDEAAAAAARLVPAVDAEAAANDRLIGRADALLESLDRLAVARAFVVESVKNDTIALGEFDEAFVALPPSVESVSLALGNGREAYTAWGKALADNVPTMTATGEWFATSSTDVYSWGESIESVEDASTAFFDSWREDLSEVEAESRSFFGAIGDLFSGFVGKLADWGADLGSKIDGAFGGLFSKLGLDLGNMFGGAIGGALASAGQMLLGKATEFIRGLFSKADAASVAASWGLSLSEEMADEIQRLGDELGGDFGTAINLSMGKIIRADMPTTLAAFVDLAQKARDVFARLDEGKVTGSQALAAIRDSALALIDAMDGAGASTADLEPLFADLVNRVKLGHLSIAEAGPVINEIIGRLNELGAAGVDNWIAIAEAAGISIDAQNRALTKGEQAWADFLAEHHKGYQEATRHNRAYFEAIAAEMGLSAETGKAWVDGMLANQREAEKERVKSNREMWRQQAIDAGLAGDQITEYVDAQIRVIRQAEREAAREAKNARRANVVEQIDDAKLVRDRMMQFIDQIGAKWNDMFGSSAAAAQAFVDAATNSTGGGSGAGAGGRSSGSPGTLFEDFGAGTPLILHGRETVVTESQGVTLAGMVGSAIRRASGGGGGGGGRVVVSDSSAVVARLDRLERVLMYQLPDAIERAARHGVATTIRRR